MRMSKAVSACVQFANWCRINKVEPQFAGELLTLAKKRFNAAVRACNVPGATSDKEDAKVEAKAAEIGWKTEYNGLMPTFVGPDGFDIRLPEVD